MDVSIVSAIIAGITGLIAGAIGSLIAPWVNWGVEKKRKKYDRRVELIDSWRQILENPDFSRKDLINHPLYGPLRELLDKKVKDRIERPSTHFVIVMNSPTNSSDRDLLLREVARIEKEWGII